MIISCNNCDKKFDIDSNVIPKNGRLLQCSSCNYKWFFKKEIVNEPVTIIKVDKPIDTTDPIKVNTNKETESTKTIELLDKIIKNDSVKEKIPEIEIIVKNNDVNIGLEKSKDKKNYNILGLIIVFIISFVALIIVLDTFQEPISNIVPNIEFLLYSLYESINDIVLFFNNLI